MATKRKDSDANANGTMIAILNYFIEKLTYVFLYFYPKKIRPKIKTKPTKSTNISINRKKNKIQVKRVAFETEDSYWPIHLRNRSGKVLFDPDEIAAVLGLNNIEKLSENFHSGQETILNITDSHGITRRKTFLQIRGINALAAHSNEPHTIDFQLWVHDIVENDYQKRLRKMKKEYAKKIRAMDNKE